MPVFNQIMNVVTGELEWKMEPDDYEFKQEIARSGYADMLHDEERNIKYREALHHTISSMKIENKEVHVLDIGTGTGLLSMMAASLGADSVTAIESFKPMATVAKKIIAANGFGDKIKVLEKYSCDVEVGPGKEMERKANVLVTEVFDTELIGEGAFRTFIHASENLLTEDAIVIPCKGTLYAQLVKSDALRKMNVLEDIIYDQETAKKIRIPQNRQNCAGAPILHDVQLSQLPQDLFSLVGDPIEIFKFDWTNRQQKLVENEQTCRLIDTGDADSVDAIFVWWDVEMGPSDNVISCAPVWAHPDFADKSEADQEAIPWRDHWMQMIFFIPKQIKCSRNEEIALHSYHDEFSLWFDVTEKTQVSTAKPSCLCRLHTHLPRHRLGLLNDSSRNNLLAKILKSHIQPSSVCLFLGHFNIYSVMAAHLGAKHVYVTESNSEEKSFLEELIAENNVQDKVTVISSSLEKYSTQDIEPITITFTDPFFKACLLPWENIHGWHVRHKGEHLYTDNCLVLPNKLIIKAIPAAFQDLAKIRTPIKSVCGYAVTQFDEMREKFIQEVDTPLEPQPLWEYPCRSLGPQISILEIDLTTPIDNNLRFKTSLLDVKDASTEINGISMWAEWTFGGSTISTGPVGESQIGKRVEWSIFHKQGVHLFYDTVRGPILCNASFNPSMGEFIIRFSPVAKTTSIDE